MAAPSLKTVCIRKWVDFTSKYGFGFTLTDGAVGVHYNDGTVIVVSSDSCDMFWYIRQGS